MENKDCQIHKLVADVLALAEGKVLLIRYNDVRKYDGQTGWFLPDDYLAYSEHPLDAAQRILREQVGLAVKDITLSYIESLEAEQGSAWHLIFHHKIELDEIPSLAPFANVKKAEWFALKEQPGRESVAHEGWAIEVIGEKLSH